MRTAFCLCAVVLGIVFLLPGGGVAGEEPKGLTLRKGQVRWRASLKEARQFIEEDMKLERPSFKPLLKLRGQKDEPPPPPEGFSCSKGDDPGVVYCRLACCVDLGEQNIVHFATMWFHNDRFFAYRVTFNTNYFDNLSSALERRFGKPTKEDQETVINPNPFAWKYGLSNFLKHTKRWETETTSVTLADRGGEGKPLVGDMAIAYLPIAREVKKGKDENKPEADLPF